MKKILYFYVLATTALITQSAQKETMERLSKKAILQAFQENNIAFPGPAQQSVTLPSHTRESSSDATDRSLQPLQLFPPYQGTFSEIYTPVEDTLPRKNKVQKEEIDPEGKELMQAIKNCDLEKVQNIVNQYPTITQRALQENNYALHLSLKNFIKKSSKYELILKNNIAYYILTKTPASIILTPGSLRFVPLHAALGKGGYSDQLVLAMIKRIDTKNVETPNTHGNSPLHIALSNDRSLKIIEALLEKGADISHINSKKQTRPLDRLTTTNHHTHRIFPGIKKLLQKLGKYDQLAAFEKAIKDKRIAEQQKAETENSPAAASYDPNKRRRIEPGV